MMRVTPDEEQRINALRAEYNISIREIFEIICQCGCEEEEIISYVKRGRVRGNGAVYTKKVKIPRNLLTKKRT